MRQVWHDLAFLHWPVPPDSLLPLLPHGLELDLHDGQAWVAITPFWMSGVALRGLPPIPGLSCFAELNVRTYVTRDGKAGVWFFSLDAASRFAVRTARFTYHLPYRDARIDISRHDDLVQYRLTRPSGERFEAEYAPCGDVTPAETGTLAHWLTERYCLYARSGDGALFRAEIHHVPWPLQPARVELSYSDLLRGHGIPAEGQPSDVRYARRLVVVIWTPERLADS